MAKNITMTQKEISIAQGFERFFRWCKLKGFSKYTIEFYDEIRMNFALFQNLDAPIEDINKELLEEYILFLQKKDITSVTVFTYLRGLKRVCNYFIDNDLIEPFSIELHKRLSFALTSVQRFRTSSSSHCPFFSPPMYCPFGLIIVLR